MDSPQTNPRGICPNTFYRLNVPTDDKETETVTFNVEMEDETLQPITLTFWHFPNRTQPIPNVDFGFQSCEFKGKTYESAEDDLDVITEAVYDFWANSLDNAVLKANQYDFFTSK